MKIPKNRLKKYFPSGTSQQKMEETIIKALELYRKRKKAGNDRHFDTKGKVYPLVVNEKSAFSCFPSPHPTPLIYQQIISRKDNKEQGTLLFGRSEILIPCMTAGSKQHKATAGVPDGRLFLIEKKGIVENEEDMETSVYRTAYPDPDFNHITDYIGSGSGSTVLDGILRESRIY